MKIETVTTYTLSEEEYHHIAESLSRAESEFLNNSTGKEWEDLALYKLQTAISILTGRPFPKPKQFKPAQQRTN